jgi:hypothetical protein
MLMKQVLTTTQIDYLYAFVQQKGVKPLDVQIELVDHLATDIENTMSVSSELTFEEGLKNVHAKFGRWDFDYFLQKAEQNIYKRQYRLMGDAFLSFFRWPKVAFTVTFAAMLWWGLTHGLEPKIIHKVVFCTLLVLVFGYGFFALWRYKKMNRELLLAKPPQWLPFCGQFPNLLNMLLGEFWQNNYSAEAYATWATGLLTLCLAFSWASVEVYENLMSESRRLYPQAFA